MAFRNLNLTIKSVSAWVQSTMPGGKKLPESNSSDSLQDHIEVSSLPHWGGCKRTGQNLQVITLAVRWDYSGPILAINYRPNKNTFHFILALGHTEWCSRLTLALHLEITLVSVQGDHHEVLGSNSSRPHAKQMTYPLYYFSRPQVAALFKTPNITRKQENIQSLTWSKGKNKNHLKRWQRW